MRICVVPWVRVRSLLRSTESSFIQMTGKSLAYWMVHFISMSPPMSVTISGCVMKEMVGLLFWAETVAVAASSRRQEVARVPVMVSVFTAAVAPGQWAAQAGPATPAGPVQMFVPATALVLCWCWSQVDT